MTDRVIFHIPPDLQRGLLTDTLALADEKNWGIAEFGVDHLRAVTRGEGVIVGVCDTGIDRSHPLLANCIDARDFTGSPSGAADRNGHGSHCSGTVAATDPQIGMAPAAQLVHAKVLGDGGSGGGDGIARGMEWAVAQGAEILSLSLGSSGEDRTITSMMATLADAGVWIVAAAGNSGPNTPDVDWPGRSPHCVSVAALNRDRSPASFSSAGAKIDTAFAGVNIWSCRPGGGFAQMSGTSMATPGVAGVLALYRSAIKAKKLPIPTITELRAMLQSDSVDTHTPGVDRRTGPGWISPLLLSLNLVPDPPKVI